MVILFRNKAVGYHIIGPVMDLHMPSRQSSHPLSRSTSSTFTLRSSEVDAISGKKARLAHIFEVEGVPRCVEGWRRSKSASHTTVRAPALDLSTANCSSLALLMYSKQKRAAPAPYTQSPATMLLRCTAARVQQ